MTLRVTKGEINKMIFLFLDHQGNKKSLSKEELFKEWFGEKYDESTATKLYENRAKWFFLRRMMKWMRRNSPYFVVNTRAVQGFRYHLVTDENDGRYFNDHLNSIVHGIRKVQDKYQSYLKSAVVRSMIVRKKKKKGIGVQ